LSAEWQREGWPHCQPRWFRRPLLRATAAGRLRVELGPDGSRQGLVLRPAPLRPAGTLVRRPGGRARSSWSRTVQR